MNDYLNAELQPEPVPPAEQFAPPAEQSAPSAEQSAPQAELLTGTFDGANWNSTKQTVRMSCPGDQLYIVTADRTYYKVDLIEDGNGLHGEVKVHPGHVDELVLTRGRGVFKVLT